MNGRNWRWIRFCKSQPVVYLAMENNIGVCLIDQFIPGNPLIMEAAGYEKDSSEKTATQGAEQVVSNYGCSKPDLMS